MRSVPLRVAPAPADGGLPARGSALLPLGRQSARGRGRPHLQEAGGTSDVSLSRVSEERELFEREPKLGGGEGGVAAWGEKGGACVV